MWFKFKWDMLTSSSFLANVPKALKPLFNNLCFKNVCGRIMRSMVILTMIERMVVEATIAPCLTGVR